MSYLVCNDLNGAANIAPQHTRSAMILSSIIRALRSWRRFNNNLRELNSMGDRELSDIGISRSDIPRVAWDASQR
jgi:uncharacterized protein YjiS (DUF1127 family)